jgi:pheromone a factor receptor
MSYPNWIFSVFSFAGFILVIIPFPWHLQSWNTGTCLFMAWTGLSCLILSINSMVWNGNAYNHAPVWCDISKASTLILYGGRYILTHHFTIAATRILVGAAVAIPAASLCINRRLYHIACVKSVTHSRAEVRSRYFASHSVNNIPRRQRRRAIMVDLAIGIGLPVLEMILRKLQTDFDH